MADRIDNALALTLPMLLAQQREERRKVAVVVYEDKGDRASPAWNRALRAAMLRFVQHELDVSGVRLLMVPAEAIEALPDPGPFGLERTPLEVEGLEAWSVLRLGAGPQTRPVAPRGARRLRRMRNQGAGRGH